MGNSSLNNLFLFLFKNHEPTKKKTRTEDDYDVSEEEVNTIDDF